MRAGVTRNRLSARRLAVLMVCLAGLLVGCDRTPEPTPPTVSTVATSSTASPTGTTTAPTTAPAPSTSSLTDDEQAIQAVQRYYAEFNKAMRTLSTQEFRKTYKEGCAACDRISAEIEATARAGQRIEGGAFSLAGLSVIGRPPNPRIRIVGGTLSVEPLLVRDRAGRIVTTEPAGSESKTFQVFHSDTGWVVSG